MAFYRIFLVALAIFVSLEGLIFRTNFYASFLEPTSSTGMFESTLRDEIIRKPFGPDEILVAGDSRMAEGFSAKIANATPIDHSYYFANVAIPGATPRTMYYLLRDLDPSHKKYCAIVLPVESYDDIEGFEVLSDRLLDLHYCIVRLRYSDVIPFASSYSTGRRQMEAFRGSLFKGLVFQSDMLTFFEHRRKRLSEVAAWREHGWQWENDYDGREEDLTDMQVHWEGKTITFPERLPASERENLTQTLFGPLPPQQGKLTRYRRLWFGRILDLYRNSNTKLIFMALARGPAVPPTPRIQPLTHSIRDMSGTPGVILLPENHFASLEDTKFYFDSLHFNRKGRNQFSSMLAQLIRSTLGPSRN